MKKLFTLALVLLVATVGYSQVRQTSKTDAKSKVATMQVSKGMESFENVQSEPNMTRTEGELDYTTYDWQTNAGPINRTIVWPDGKVNFAYTMATDGSYSDRGTGIGTYDYNNDEWIPLGGRIENEKTGFGSIARFKDNGIVIAAHTATECGIYIVENKDDLTSLQGTIPCTLRLNNDNEPTWPIVMTSGANRDIIREDAVRRKGLVAGGGGAEDHQLAVAGRAGALRQQGAALQRAGSPELTNDTGSFQNRRIQLSDQILGSDSAELFMQITGHWFYTSSDFSPDSF